MRTVAPSETSARASAAVAARLSIGIAVRQSVPAQTAYSMVGEPRVKSDARVFCAERGEQCLNFLLWVFRSHDATHHSDTGRAGFLHGRGVVGVDAAKRYNGNADPRSL